MSLKTTTALAALGLFVGSAALAETPAANDKAMPSASVGVEGNVAIKDLPKSGPITLTGTIESVENGKKFSLRDANDDTIDVETSNETSLTEGDFVKVQGSLDDKAMGMGRKIISASVTKLGSHGTGAKPGDDNRAAGQNRSDATSANASTSIAALPTEGAIIIAGTVDATKPDNVFTLRDADGKTIDVQTPTKLSLQQGDYVQVEGTARTSGETREIAAASVTQLGNNAGATAKSAFNNAKQATGNAIDSAGNAISSAATSTKNAIAGAASSLTGSASETADATAGAVPQSLISELPKKGEVALNGTVDSVDEGEKSFILRDQEGKTIDVHSKEALTINKGDYVLVSGTMTSEFAGMGKEIHASSVQVSVKR